jgi:hypothetical protein
MDSTRRGLHSKPTRRTDGAFQSSFDQEISLFLQSNETNKHTEFLQAFLGSRPSINTPSTQLTAKTTESPCFNFVQSASPQNESPSFSLPAQMDATLQINPTTILQTKSIIRPEVDQSPLQQQQQQKDLFISQSNAQHNSFSISFCDDEEMVEN